MLLSMKGQLRHGVLKGGGSGNCRPVDACLCSHATIQTQSHRIPDNRDHDPCQRIRVAARENPTICRTSEKIRAAANLIAGNGHATRRKRFVHTQPPGFAAGGQNEHVRHSVKARHPALVPEAREVNVGQVAGPRAQGRSLRPVAGQYQMRPWSGGHDLSKCIDQRIDPLVGDELPGKEEDRIGFTDSEP